MVKFSAGIRRPIIIVIVLLLSTIGMYLRFDRRAKAKLWNDERYQISGMKISLKAAIGLSRENIQFPGDYILVYPFYRLFGENKWGLAIPHIIITIIGFYLFYILCRKYLKTVLAYIIAFTLFAYNYNLVRLAFEIRPYSVMVTLGLASFLIFQYIFECEDPPLITRFLICIFIFITILFSVFGGYILFFNYIFHLLSLKNRERLGRLLIKHIKYYGLGVISAIPILYLYLSGSGGITPVGYESHTFEFIPQGIISILKGVFGNLTGPRKFYLLLSGLIINLLIPHRERLEQLAFFIILIILPIVFLLFICIYFNYWFIQRLFIWAIPLFAFFLGWCWDSIIIYFLNGFKLWLFAGGNDFRRKVIHG